MYPDRQPDRRSAMDSRRTSSIQTTAPRWNALPFRTFHHAGCSQNSSFAGTCGSRGKQDVAIHRDSSSGQGGRRPRAGIVPAVREAATARHHGSNGRGSRRPGRRIARRTVATGRTSGSPTSSRQMTIHHSLLKIGPEIRYIFVNAFVMFQNIFLKHSRNLRTTKGQVL